MSDPFTALPMTSLPPVLPDYQPAPAAIPVRRKSRRIWWILGA